MLSRMDDTKCPRHYAAEIAELPTREARVEALARVPEPLREWVRYYVAVYFPILKRFKQAALDTFERNANQHARRIRRIQRVDRAAALQSLPPRLRERVVALLTQWETSNV